MSDVVKVNFRLASGETVTVSGEVGETLMSCAVDNAIDGIIGECGGSLACATCHGYVDKDWLACLPPPSDQEKAMLEGCIEVRPTSRLTCQIKLEAALDGLTIEVPASQT